MNWIKINNSTDIENLMDLFGGFHDSCLKELYMWTEAFVDENLSMSMAVNPDTCVRILFQRQDQDPSAIEMLFKEVTNFHIHPRIDQDSIIYGAKLLMKNGQLYWAEDQEWQIDQPFLSPISWISAKEIHWRDVSTWMGKEQRYGVISDEETL